MSDDKEQEARFVRALSDDVYDSTTRLVYSDWLEERGRDDEAQEQRRMAAPEWVQARAKLEGAADRLRTKTYLTAPPQVFEDLDYDWLMDCLRREEIFLPYDYPTWLFDERAELVEAYKVVTGQAEGPDIPMIACSC